MMALAVSGDLRAGTESIARVWDERALAAIRVDTPIRRRRRGICSASRFACTTLGRPMIRMRSGYVYRV